VSWYKSLTEKSFFIIIFTLVATFGLARALGFSGNDLLETAINAIITTLIVIILTQLIFYMHKKDLEGD
jgi:hypothetical protein